MACDLNWELVPELRGRVGRSFLIDPAALTSLIFGAFLDALFCS